ncbi:MAG: DUF932 domain-containing protein [Symploca sp. SIO2C1]|nr:DUF932 domain-containing protein [Symploca sp. SIO2C1]
MLTEETKLFKGVGAAIEPGMSVRDVLVASGLNWDVNTTTFQYEAPLGLQDSGKFGTLAAYRSDNSKLLTVIGKGWKPYQNRQLIKDFFTFCHQSNLTPDWAGFISRKPNSRSHLAQNMAFVSAQIPEEQGGVFHLSPDEVINSRVVFFNHHTYGYGAGGYLLTCRQICTNGMTLTVKETSRLISHIQSQIDDRDRIIEVLNSMMQALNEYNQNLTKLAETPITPEEALVILIKDFGFPGKELKNQPRIVQTCLNLFLGYFDDEMREQGVELGTSTLAAYRTAYGLLQSVTAYRTHLTTKSSSTSQVLSMFNGDSAKVMNRAYRSLVKMTRSHKTITVPVGVRTI